MEERRGESRLMSEKGRKIKGQYKRRDGEKDIAGQRDRNRLNEKNLAIQIYKFEL